MAKKKKRKNVRGKLSEYKNDQVSKWPILKLSGYKNSNQMKSHRSM